MIPDPDASRPDEPARSLPAPVPQPWRRPYESALPGPDAQGLRAMLVSSARGAAFGRQLGGLEALGCESVVPVRDARHAVAMAGSVGPRLVVIDLHGPDVDLLLDAARALRRWPGLALVLAIGELDDRRLDAARAIDPHGVVARPCHGDALARTVAIAFARLRSEAARRATEPGGLEETWRVAVSSARCEGRPFCVGILQARRPEGPRTTVDDGRLAVAIRMRMREALGHDDGIAPIGPLSFAFITGCGGPQGIARPGGALVSAFAPPVRVGASTVPLRVGIGLAPWGIDEDDLASMLHGADSVIPSTRRALTGRWRAVSPQRARALRVEAAGGVPAGPTRVPLVVALGWGAFALALWAMATRGSPGADGWSL